MRCWGELRLVAVPASGGERYYVAQGERPPFGTFTSRAAAVAFFEALRAAWGAPPGVAPRDQIAGDLDAARADAWARRAEARLRGRAPAAGVVDLLAYRRRRDQRRARGGSPRARR
jgi:hypothetical protein